MRAIWRGHIRFSLVTIPVRIYNAIETAETIRFNQLHKDDNSPVRYEKRCKKCDEVLKQEDLVKGYKYEPDQYVIIKPGDLEKLKLKSTKVIEIQGFVDASEVPATLYDAPYFAGPDGEVASKAYALLCETLRRSNKLGIGKVVLRDRESVMLMAPHADGGLIMYKLRYPQEVRAVKDVPQLDDAVADEDQLKLAQTLVDSMSKSFDQIELRDTYKDAVKELIAQKIDGKEVVAIEEEEQPVVDIMTALKASIEQAAAEKKPMKRATGKKAGAETRKRRKTA